MVDTVDIAQEQTESLHAKRIEETRKRAGKLEHQATGYCLNCDEKLEPGRRFCDAACRDDYERLLKRSSVWQGE